MLKEDITKSEVRSLTKSEIENAYSSPKFKKMVEDLTKEVLEELFKTLYTKKGFWKNG